MARCLCMEKSLLRRLYRKRIVRVFVIVVVVVVCGLRWRKQRESSEREISCMQLHLYSAHERTLDGAAMVTLVGLADRDNVSSTHVTCRFTVGKEEPESGGHWDTQGTILVLPEHHGERFGAILIDCPLHDVPTRPNFVSVVLNETDPYLHTVRITSPESGPPRLQMALCVPPIHGGYNRWEELIETLELLQLLGVDHAEMYLLDAGPNVTSVLNYYVTRGFLRLHTWPDPPQPVHYFGQLAAVNDCLLRMRNVAKLVMFADLDEVIVPHRHDSLSDMLQDVLKQQNDSDHVGAFNFLNSFFVPSNDSEAQSRLLQNSTLNSDQIRLADSLGLKAVSGVYHGKVFPFTERSKCIVDPLTVTMMQVHFVGIFSKGFRSVTVDPSISLLHHYRGREDKENLVPETSALKFVPELTRRVRVSGLALDFKQRTTMYSCGERILPPGSFISKNQHGALPVHGQVLLRRFYKKRIVRVFVIVVVVVCGLRWRKQRESSELEISCMQLQLQLYSAHERTLDGAAMVTLVGLADRGNLSSTNVTCRFTVWKEEPESGGHWDTQGTIFVLPEHHDERFGAILIDCPLHDVPRRPNFVSVVLNETDPYLHTVRITSPESGPPRLQMALCVPPIHGSYNRWEELIETLELLQLLGVDHAEMYLLDAEPNVISVLNYYVTRGFLRLHEWPDPPQTVHYFGQLAAVNDCLLRMRNVAKLVMFADLDEVIVPHHHDSLSDMLQDVLKQQNDSDHVGAFNFLHSFFVPSNDSEAQSRLLQNSTLNSDQIRLARSLGLKAVSGVYHGKVFPFTDRSKCIVDPLTVTMMQVHFVGNFSKGFRSVTVDPSVSLLHHYRGRVKNDSLVPETSALKFVPELIRRVHSVWTSIGFQAKDDNV
ncbi:uncharacterized protein LOC112566960 [Pomacea canaliculata]|uniref:uncharacterized protein LOC112566960 n=1 Tax=Pomacea canaliculata TaxID=400727 RepID=UPI000D7312C9|nr:uncharacterized protein LOC112566960 [Pomacea canaliculata]